MMDKEAQAQYATEYSYPAPPPYTPSEPLHPQRPFFPPPQQGSAPPPQYVFAPQQQQQQQPQVASYQGGGWHFPLFSCLDDLSTCLITFFASFITEWQLSKQLGHPKYAQFLLLLGIFFATPLVVLVYVVGYAPMMVRQDRDGWVMSQMLLGVIYMVMMGAIGARFVILVKQRSQIRHQLNVPGGCVDDCCTLYWCGPCAVCQMKREADYMAQIDSFNRCATNIPTAIPRM